MNIIEYKYLVCIYLLVIDKEIHSEELKFLKNQQFELGEQCKIEAKKILSDDNEKVDILVILDKLKSIDKNDQVVFLELLIKLSYSDGYFHQKESDFIKKVGLSLKVESAIVNHLIHRIGSDFKILYSNKKQSIFEKINESINKILYDFTDDEYFEENLLEGNSFVEKIKQIAARAKDDLELASEKMLKFNSLLEKNFNKIETYSEKIEKIESQHKKDNLLEFIRKLNQETKKDIITSINDNTQVLEKKKYTVDYFTIAFLGRTKAGKSTFHKLITGEETDDVGIGKLRTTRFNRIFNWENLRIIDTPGIGAPGGQNDIDIARSIIDEADLVCYVVTNDAIQETEFNFLSELKNKNKPIFVIINYKENLEHPIRFEKFLKNPKAWLENKNDKSLDGHIKRINEMISKFHYDPNLIEIVPVHLLAAELAKEVHRKYNKQLIDGSNIKLYNKVIKQTVFRNGHLKKMQNIIDGCNYQTSLTLNKTTNDINQLSILLKQVKSEKISLIKYFEELEKSTIQEIRMIIKSIHKEMEAGLKEFANNEYDNKDISNSWRKFLEDKGYYNSLNLKLEEVISDFQQNIQAKIKESLQDITINISNLDIPKIEVDISNYKFVASFAYSIVSAILVLTMKFAAINFWNPTGWAAAGVTAALTGVGILINFSFDSKEKKIKKAVEKIITIIQPKIQENEKEIMKDLDLEFLKSSREIKNKLNTNFDEMIDGLINILKVLKSINKSSKTYSDYFNKVLFFRSLEHLGKIKLKGILTEQTVNRYLSNTTITREKENLNIDTKYKLKKEEVIQLNKALQLNITIG